MRRTSSDHIKVWLLLALLVLQASCASTLSVSSEARSQLAPGGKLRAAINFGNPVLAVKDSTTGDLRGVTVELSRELARRIGAKLELVGYDTVAKLMDGLKAGAWDVAFLAVDPARAGEVTFTAPYMEVENTYLVPERSDIRNVSQIDRPGIRVAVQVKDAADLFLTRELKQASLVRAPDGSAAFNLLKSGSADAFANNRQRLLSIADTNSGYRVVDGRFYAIPHAALVLAERTAAAIYLRSFIEDVKASGFVRRAIDQSGLRGVVVAPPGSPAH
jgi:polar amino acid transport system substrate-binding protein